MIQTCPIRLAVRWTVGDVSWRGYEALQRSIWGAVRIFGPETRYIVCVNSIPMDDARQRTGSIPRGVQWHDNTNEIPAFVKQRIDSSDLQGVAWKLAPLRMFDHGHELSLDNDCILWGRPAAMNQWLAQSDRALLAADVVACMGRFQSIAARPLNSGIRGLPPGFDLERALRLAISQAQSQGQLQGQLQCEFRNQNRADDVRHGEQQQVVLDSELDEQGWQAAALSRCGEPLVVSLDDVTICSPFPLHQLHLGRCGAHFVGINGISESWMYCGRSAQEWKTQHWRRYRSIIQHKVAMELPTCEQS
jgi:hypothetical protein